MAGSGKDLVSLAARHMRLMLEKAPGPKILLLDGETTGIVSLAITQSEVLQKEVSERASYAAAWNAAQASASTPLKLPLLTNAPTLLIHFHNQALCV